MKVSSAHIILGGRVQGVGFRWFVEREAELLGLVGTVRNLPDGCVEIRAEGERDLIESLIDILKRGNGASRVDRCDIRWGEDKGEYDSFRIVFTGY